MSTGFLISKQLNVQTILFQIILFSINALLSFSWPLDRILSGATIPCQRRPLSNGSEGEFCIPQSFNNAEASPPDF